MGGAPATVRVRYRSPSRARGEKPEPGRAASLGLAR